MLYNVAVCCELFGVEIELFRFICRGLGYGILYLLGTTLTTLGTTYMVPLT